MNRLIVRGAAAALALAIPSGAVAAVTVDITQSGSDVITTVSGTLDTTGLEAEVTDTNEFLIIKPLNGLIGSGVFDSNTSLFFGLNGPSSFGSGDATLATSGAGDQFFLIGSAGELELSPTFVSGSNISSSATYANATIASLGLTPGQYVFNAPNDTITVNIGAAVPEPATWAMMLLGFVGMGAAMRRSRRRDMARVRVA